MKYLITSLVLFTISVWVMAISPSPVPGSAEIVASMRDNVYESITLKLGDGCTVDEIGGIEYYDDNGIHVVGETLLQD